MKYTTGNVSFDKSENHHDASPEALLDYNDGNFSDSAIRIATEVPE